jgi:hypothetical protein
MLKGMQLSMLQAVEPYPLENRPYQAGDWLTGQTRTGKTVTGQYARQTASGWLTLDCAGEERAIAPDTAHLVEPPGVRQLDLLDFGDRLQVLQQRFYAKQAQARQTPEHPSSPPAPPPRARRRSPRGQASGWIEERQGNKQRQKPSTSYYYGWQVAGEKHKRYIPATKVLRVQRLILERRTVVEILDYLTGGNP